ncbi:NAD-dependent epimerase/dehydratase family protein [Patescibacteria group bacterium]|nr:MAG: NAD-dependent epimerase/dehydratase family protein [Patescibacteria group bacterium]
MTPGYWRDKKILVTGASGFLGSALTEALLVAGARVVALLRDEEPESEFFRRGLARRVVGVRGDLASYPLVERALNEYAIDTCFHLAAQPLVTVANRSPLSTFESNIKGTWNVLEACRRQPLVKRVVVASSDKAYGESRQLPYVEDAPLVGGHPYDVSKSCADLLAQSYFRSWRLPVAIARCGNFYGGGDLYWDRIVPGTFRSLARGEQPVIRSDGSLVRDYFYIRDVVTAYLTLAEALDRPEVQGEAFNFGTETPTSVLELVRAMRATAGRPDLEPIVLGSSPNEIPAQYLSTEKARRLLNWRPDYTLARGLCETWAWYLAYFNNYD